MDRSPTDRWIAVDHEGVGLAPYAMKSSESAGRKVPEPDHPYRGMYQRDRDRILHSSAFRRLAGKMQVFTGEMGDYHRTRLTHTFEVSSIARTISRALILNEDLVEALSLFHDVGHPPFGHAGEAALHDCLSDQGGFSHNQHAVTIAEELEQTHRPFPGLNLTAEVLTSQLSRIDKSSRHLSPLLEAQVVDAADNITYDAHDTDDAVKLGLLSLDELEGLPLIARLLERVRQRGHERGTERMRKALVHELIDFQVSDLLQESSASLRSAGCRTAEQARHETCLIRPSPSLAVEKRELETCLSERVYRHPRLMEVRSRAQTRIRQMFDRLQQEPASMPIQFQQRVEVVGVRRAVGEYIAGMTDRFFDQQFARVVGGGFGG